MSCRLGYLYASILTGASLNVSRLTHTTFKKVPRVNTNDTTPIMPVVRKNGDVGVGLDTTTPIAGRSWRCGFKVVDYRDAGGRATWGRSGLWNVALHHDEKSIIVLSYP
jgi:hypothetical protein